MPNYWWVNHKQTVRQEILGGYLWSPKIETNGARSQYYENMRAVSVGDYVLSFANSEIRYVGRVIDNALNAPKPDFGAVGKNWAQEGWLVPMQWEKLAASVRPKDLIEILRPLLPEKYSPIQAATGNGNQKAYLTKIDQKIFSIVVGGSYEFSISDLAGTKFDEIIEKLNDDAENIVASDTQNQETQKHQLILARRGQGVFRTNVARIEKSCRITGITTLAHLRASHIKPWRSSNSDERLDGNNGLLLTPNADHLFDRGLISFQDNGGLMISTHLKPWDYKLLLAQQIPAAPFVLEQQRFLRYHRNSQFLP